MRKRCQICDGPVVNGRCSLCGMPYRNDEVMYHLNETRRDHYQHATSKARVQMRQDEIPYGDKTVPNTPRRKNPSASASRSRSAAKSVHYSQTRSTASVSPQTKTVSHAGAAASQNSSDSSEEGFIRSTYKGDITKNTGKRKGKGRKIFWILVIIWFFLQRLSGVSSSGIAEWAEDTWENITGTADEGIWEIITDTADEDSDYTAPDTPALMQLVEGDSLTVGTDIPASSYTFSIEDGSATIRIEGQNTRTFTIENGEYLAIVSSGDVITIEETDPEESIVEIR